jgi:metalloendopeptidase OMA1, mitochondrial
VYFIAVSGLTHLKWEVHLIDSPQRNAFVLPGGKVFVFTGLLPIVKDENGLAAVLGHEIAHQVARHAAEKMSWAKILLVGQLVVSFFFDAGFLFNRLFVDLGLMVCQSFLFHVYTCFLHNQSN